MVLNRPTIWPGAVITLNSIPILLCMLKKTKDQVELGSITARTEEALLPVIDDCFSSD